MTHSQMAANRQHQTFILMMGIALTAIVSLILECSGVVTLSFQGNSVYNPMPSYGPLREPEHADHTRESAPQSPRRQEEVRETRTLQSQSTVPMSTIFHWSAPTTWWESDVWSQDSSSSQTRAEARAARRQRIEQRRSLRGE